MCKWKVAEIHIYRKKGVITNNKLLDDDKYSTFNFKLVELQLGIPHLKKKFQTGGMPQVVESLPRDVSSLPESVYK